MAESLGAGAVMVTPSREPVPSEDRVFEYFRQAVQGISIPVVEMDHPTAGKVRLIGSPMKFSGTPVEYRLPPPLLGEHTASVLKERLGLE